jgi:hypothetical protein
LISKLKITQGATMSTINTLKVSIFFVIMLSFSACTTQGSKHQDNAVTAQQAAGATVQVSFESSTPLRAYTNISDIEEIKLDISDINGTVYATDLNFVQEGSNWSISLPFLPMNAELIFKAQAYNSSSLIIYTGETAATLVDTDSIVTITLYHEDSSTRVLPVVKNITTYMDGTDTKYSFHLTNSNQDDLSYVIQSDYGTFTPANGTMDFTTTDNTLDTSFVSSSYGVSQDNLIGSISLTNTKGDIFTSVFDIASSGDVVIHVAPDILSLEVNHTHDILDLKVHTNESADLTYLWSISNDFGNDTVALSTNDTQQVQITGFDANRSLEVNITVTDTQTGASSSVLYLINEVLTVSVDDPDPFDNDSGIALYKFEGDSNDETGVYNGVPDDIVYNSTAKYGSKSVEFRANNSDSIETGISLPNDTFSISFWIKSSFNINTEGSHHTFAISRNGLGDNNGIYILFYNGYSDGGRVIDVMVKDNLIRAISYNDGESGIDDNEWHHITFTKEETNAKIFLDGNLLREVNDVPISANHTHNLRLGAAQPDSDYRSYVGLMDQVRVFNRALSANQVQALYQEQ